MASTGTEKEVSHSREVLGFGESTTGRSCVKCLVLGLDRRLGVTDLIGYVFLAFCLVLSGVLVMLRSKGFG